MTENYPVDGREQYVARMNQVAYMEFPQFQGEESLYNFCCFSCPYMVKDPSTSTGYWCKKVGFPDRPFGCCDVFQWKMQEEEGN